MTTRIKVLLSVLLVLSAVGAIVWLSFLRPANYRMNLDQTAVIKQMRELNRLETTSFTIEKIIEAGTNGGSFNEFLFGDRVLLIAHGEVIAGFDFAKLNDKDIQIEGETLRLQLPAPEILVVRLDNEQTRVYDRDQGLLTKGNKDLEAEARKAAEAEIRKAACQADILDDASTNARKQLTTLFKALGFVTVIVETPKGQC